MLLDVCTIVLTFYSGLDYVLGGDLLDVWYDWDKNIQLHACHDRDNAYPSCFVQV
jgi:hypothetical protein